MCEQLEDRTTPAVFTVTNVSDVPIFPAVNLRQAIDAANAAAGADTIVFAPGLFTGGNLTLEVLSTLPTITDDLTIDGTAGQVTVKPANQPAQFRLFQIQTPGANLPVRVNVEFKNLTVTGGNASNPADPNGGGIAMINANLTLNGCVVSGNGAVGNGGGLWASGNPSLLTLKNNTLVSNNTAAVNGGGVAVTNTLLKVEEGTQVRNNTAGVGGGGIAAFADGFKGIVGLPYFVDLNGTAAGFGPVVVNNNTAQSGDGGGVLVRVVSAGPGAPDVNFQKVDVNGNTARGVAPAPGQPWTSGRGGGVAVIGDLTVDADTNTNVKNNRQSAPAPTTAPFKLGVYLEGVSIFSTFPANANVADNTQLP